MQKSSIIFAFSIAFFCLSMYNYVHQVANCDFCIDLEDY